MNDNTRAATDEGKAVLVIGGGFAGTVFALKYARQNSGTRVVLLEKDRKAGLGLAYGACDPQHLLNVPVHRMELGLTPGFQDWLVANGHLPREALAEAGNTLADAFVPRALFGAYLRMLLAASAARDGTGAIRIVRGEAVRLLDFPRRGVQLSDGRRFEADLIVLATGNLAPNTPRSSAPWLVDSSCFAADPWSSSAFDELDKDAPVILLGTGLTMVDIALRLDDRGHSGALTAISRHGRMPTAHCFGGTWMPFIEPDRALSPYALLRLIRGEAAKALSQRVPWQRVIDAVRPAIARVWHGWSPAERAQFLRHLRAPWDVHRHRMAPRIAARIEALMARGQLKVIAGRLSGCTDRDGGIRAIVQKRGTRETIALDAAQIVNCTGPRSDFNDIAIPIFGDLKRRGLIKPDALGLGLETQDCAVVGAAGHVSPWLYAIGPLTRPAWWEVTAVPEINAQIDHLVRDLSRAPSADAGAETRSLADAFLELGSGI